MYTFNLCNLVFTRLQFNVSFLDCKWFGAAFQQNAECNLSSLFSSAFTLPRRTSAVESTGCISSCFISRCISTSIDWLFDAHQFVYVYKTPNLATVFL